MPTPALQRRVQGEAYALVGWQIAAVCLLALLGTLWKGSALGLGVLAGGMAYALPNLIFVWTVFRFTRAHQMTLFMIAFFVGETLKLILSAILVLVIVKTLAVSLLSTLVGLIGAIISFWIVCILHFSRKAVIK